MSSELKEVQDLNEIIKELVKAEKEIVKYDKYLKIKVKLAKLKKEVINIITDFTSSFVHKYIKTPINKTIKVIQYIPVIWGDEDWDYYYLMRLVGVKIIRMKNYLLKENIICSSELKEISDSIDKTCKHMDNHANYYEVYTKENPLPFEVEYKHIPSADGKSHIIEEWNARKNRPLNKTEQQQYNRYIKGLEKFKNKEWDAIWDTIKVYGRSWWS